MGALAIHDFIVQVMIHNPERKSYTRLIIITYILGCSAYLYMGFGSFAVINRTPVKSDPEVISEYFGAGEWQVHLIQLIYSIHLITALPEFILISKYFYLLYLLECVCSRHSVTTSTKESLFHKSSTSHSFCSSPTSYTSSNCASSSSYKSPARWWVSSTWSSYPSPYIWSVYILINLRATSKVTTNTTSKLSRIVVSAILYIPLKGWEIFSWCGLLEQ